MFTRQVVVDMCLTTCMRDIRSVRSRGTQTCFRSPVRVPGVNLYGSQVQAQLVHSGSQDQHVTLSYDGEHAKSGSLSISINV